MARDELHADRQVGYPRVGTDIAGWPVMLNGAVKIPKGTIRAQRVRRVGSVAVDVAEERRRLGQRGREQQVEAAAVGRPPLRHPARPGARGLQRFDVGGGADRAAALGRAPR